MNKHSIERVNQVLLYIDENLDENLNLERMSGIGLYSPFHLHRLFKAVTGETINAYVIRKRIEKTAWMLMNQSDISIAELAIKFGFSNNASFTKSFRKFYGVSPTEFRKKMPGEYSKIVKMNSKIGQSKQIFEQYICNIDHLKKYIQMNAKIEIKELPKQQLAFITNIGTNGMEQHFDKILKWGRSKGLFENSNSKLVRIYHDSFKITEPEKIRMSACITLDKPIEASGEIGLRAIDKGRYLTGRFEIPPNELGQAWDSLVVWMNENGYQKAEGDPFEIYYNNFNSHPEKKCIVDLCIPVE